MDRVRKQLKVARMVLLAIAVACGDDPVGPRVPDDVNVAVTFVSFQGPVIRGDLPGGYAVMCSAEFRAVATGRGRAAWATGIIRWYVGTNRSVAVDSAVLDGDEVRSSFGSAAIEAGETRTSTRWAFTVSIPFAASLEFRYTPFGGNQRTTTASFTCGPEVPTNPTAPVISALSVGAVTGPLEPGDVLTVDYTASSPSGLWETGVQLSGPCEVLRTFSDTLGTTASRAVQLAIPAECQLGVPITIVAFAYDAFLLERTRVVATALSLVDVTPPDLLSFNTGGIYFVGDSIPFHIQAFDNHKLSTIVWEISPGGVRDSLAATGPGRIATVYLRVRPEWVGGVRVRAFARDAVGLVSDTVESGDSTRVFPSVDRRLRSVAIQGEVRDVVFDARRGLVYVLQGNDRRIAVVDTATMTVIRTINTVTYPNSFELSPGGDSLVMTFALSRALGVIDLRQPSYPITDIPLVGLDSAAQQYPAAVREAVNGKAMVALEGTKPTAYTLMEVDLTAGTQRLRTDAGVDGHVGGVRVARSHDGGALFVTGGVLQRYDAATDSFGPPGAPHYGSPSVDATGDRLLLGRTVFAASLNQLVEIEGPHPSGIPTSTISPDGQFAYAYWGGTGIVRSRVSDGKMIDRSPGPAPFADLMRVSGDGHILIIGSGVGRANGSVAIMDLQ